MNARSLFLRAFVLTTLGGVVADARVGTLEGRVVGVVAPSDLIVQDKAGAKRRIRIVALGLPAEGHPRRAEAIRELGRLSLQRPVRVETFGLVPGCSGQEACAMLGRPLFSGVDPALALLRKGLAYHDRTQMGEQSTTDRMLFTEAQTEAQKARRGVWSDPAGTFQAPRPAPAPVPRPVPKKPADGDAAKERSSPGRRPR
jgi:endonuclease YncB( thermonuclease family)